jgi:hypothetical protein
MNIRFGLVLLSLAALAGWALLRRPSSPSDLLESVSYSAFVAHAPDAAAGGALAKAVREWVGVTAATYNDKSDLLVVAYSDRWTPDALKSRLSTLTSRAPQIKHFETNEGQQCPVPAAYLEIIPDILFVLFLISTGALFLLIFGKNRHTQLTQVQ